MHLEVLIEEASAEPVVRRVVEAVGAHDTYEVRTFEGKQDLLRSLPERLDGYRRWDTDLRILVLVDRDDDDCLALKQRLELSASRAQFATRATAGGGTYSICNRIACEELEAWFVGDEKALLIEFPRLRPFAKRAALRDPDSIAGGTWEALERLLQHHGYYRGGLLKSDLARRLAPQLDLEANRSASFRSFVTGTRALLSS